MNYIANIEKKGDDITFQIQNHKENEIPIQVSLVNALRRIILTDIPIVGVSELKTQFPTNTSMLNNGILSHRMSLVSVINSQLIRDNYENITINLNKANKGDDMVTYYLRDCEVTNGNQKIDNDKIFKFPNTPIGNVKHGQTVVMNAKLDKSTVRESNSGAFCPTGTCVYYFDYEKDNPDDDKERFYLRDDKGNPLIYNFSIESSGQLDPVDVFEEGIEILIGKLNAIKQDLVDKNGIKVVLEKSPTIMKAVDLRISDENDTIGNLIVQYIPFVEKVNYRAYDIVHPLVNTLVLRIAHGDNSFEEVSDVVVRTIDFLTEFLGKLRDEWAKKN